MQILQKAKTYDVCIVGSGAGGGMAAKVLAEAGAERVLLEAGPPWAADKDGAMFAWNYDSPRRGRRLARAALRRVRRLHRRLGHRGRALHDRARARSSCGSARACWAGAPTTGAASRCASVPATSRRAASDGLGDDWPIGYDDIKPYYDKLDRFVGLFGVDGGPGERARRHLPAAARAARARAADQEGLRPARDHVHPLAPVDPHPAAQRPRRPATTAASAAAAARRTRTSRRPRCCCRRRSRPASSRSSPAPWRARC